MPKAKIILTQISPQTLRGFEGRVVARQSGLVKIVKIYGASERMDYHFMNKPNEMLFGHLSSGFFAIVAWMLKDEEQMYYMPCEIQTQDSTFHII